MPKSAETGKTIRISTGATCDLPQQWIQENGVVELPLFANFGTDSKRTDDPELTLRYVINRALVSDKEHFPQTAAPGPDLIKTCWAVYDGPILPILASPDISAVWTNAELARQQLSEDPEQPRTNILPSISSRSTSLGEGFIVMKVQELIAQGYSEEQIRNEVNKTIPLTHMFSIPGNVLFPYRGKRISGIEAIGASVLKLKGLAHAYEDKIQIVGKFRTHKDAFRHLMDFAAEHAPVEYMGVLHTGDDVELAHQLLDEALKKVSVNPDHVIFSAAGIPSLIHNGDHSVGFGIVQGKKEPFSIFMPASPASTAA